MKLNRLLIILFSAGLFALAIPNELFHYGNPLLGLFALAPFFYILYTCKKRRQAALSGALFAFINSLLTYFWLLFFLDFSVWTITGVALAHGIYFWVLSQFLHRIAEKASPYRPFLIALTWIVYEYIKSLGFLGFPWGLIPYSVNMILPLIQTADLLGVWGVGFILALSNSLITEIILKRENPGFLRIEEKTRAPLPFRFRKFLDTGLGFWSASCFFWLLLVMLSLLYGVVRMNQPIPVEKRVQMVLVQQNTDSWADGKDLQGLLTSQDLTRRALKGAKKPVDLVVWSENSLRRPYINMQKRYLTYPPGDPFIPFLKEIQVPLLTGSPFFLDLENFEAMNAVILLDPQGNSLGIYGKQHLVPVAERIPFYSGFVETFFRNVIGLDTAGWTPGKEYTIFSLPLKEGGSFTFGTPICFEDSFAYLCRNFYRAGAEILINLTNDSWSQTVSAQTQHFVSARFRSIENRRVLVRSSNSGVSTVIDPWGRMNDTLPFFQEAYGLVEVPVYIKEKPTVYSLFGDLLPQIFILILICYLIYMVFRKS